MINQRRAFNRYTTARHYIQTYLSGHYDALNNWVGEGYSNPVPFACTPIAYGDRDSGVSGQTLKATEIGERQPSFMQVHSRTPMPIKSLLTIYGYRYKVVSLLDYTDAGFHKVVAARELEQ